MTTEAAPARLSTHPMRGVVVLVGILGGIYSISQFLRNSVGVIAPNLASELDLHGVADRSPLQCVLLLVRRLHRFRLASRWIVTDHGAACCSALPLPSPVR